LDKQMGELRAAIRRHRALIRYAVLCTLGAMRSGYGRLTLSALARSLPTRGTQKARYKRLGRFLNNKHFCPEAMVPARVKGEAGTKGHRRAPIRVDQTGVAGVPTILAGGVHRGRVLPMGFTCVEYAQMRRGRNALETAFGTLILGALPPGCQAIFTADRAYGRYPLLQARRLRFETLRRTPRHGTPRTRSVLSHGMLWLAVPDLAPRAWGLPLRIIAALTRGTCAYRPEPLLQTLS
jgi:hypothetical protein